MEDAAAVRPTLNHGPVDSEREDAGPQPFCTWPELRALVASGRVDVQTHTQTHAMVFSESRALGVLGPEYRRDPMLVRPWVQSAGGFVAIEPSRLGYPLFPCRSRTAALAFTPNPTACARLEEFVRDHGGAAFFAQPNARETLAPMLADVGGTSESEAVAIAQLNLNLPRRAPRSSNGWGNPSSTSACPGAWQRPAARALGKLGFSTAVANRWPGRLAPGRGDDPFFIKRLHSRHLFALPGRGRKVFVTLGGR